jgi:hypothetical protein
MRVGIECDHDHLGISKITGWVMKNSRLVGATHAIAIFIEQRNRPNSVTPWKYVNSDHDNS